MQEPSRALSWTIGTLVVCLAFAAGMWLSARQAVDGRTVEGLLWPDPPRLGPFQLLDHDQRTLDRDRLRGRWSLVFFGFTHCPDICPTALAALATAQEELRKHTLYGASGQVVFVSVDPERDSPATLGRYVRHFSEDFVAATAAESDLKALTAALGVLFMKVAQADGGYSVDHSAGIFFISPDLRLVSVLTPPQTAADIVRRFVAVSEFIQAQG
jgi:cytochrome oxidase Cu insertion factor (SCO1/SenC/PrrC family)